MDPDAARRILLEQHDRLRAHLGACGALARRLVEHELVHTQLDAALAQLRDAFSEHNATEAELIRPLLDASPRWGARLVDRMLEEHVAEHVAFHDVLQGSAAEVAARLEDLIEELDAHMAAEERTFLSPRVLDEDAIKRHADRNQHE